MSNQGFVGFLIRKTVQPHSSRKDPSNFNDFRNSNMIVYLNKKIGDIRSRLDRNGASELPRSVFTSTHLQMKPKARADHMGLDKPVFTNYKIDPTAKKVMERLLKPEPNLDDFFVETNASRQRPKSAQKSLAVDTQLRVLMNENIGEKELEGMFTFYKRQNLRASWEQLNQIRTQMKDPKFYKKLQERMGEKGLQAVEFEDKESVNYFMNKVCQQNSAKSTAGKVLGVNEDNIIYKAEIHDEFEAMRSIVQKRITQEQLKAITEREEDDQRKRLIQIFRETRPDQVDPDFFKNKIKMTTMKKLNEVQDQQYHNFFSSGAEPSHTKSASTFIRQPRKFKGKFTQTRSKINTAHVSTVRETDQNKSTASNTMLMSSAGFRLNLQSMEQSTVRPKTTRRPLSTVSDRYKKIDPEVLENVIETKGFQHKASELIEQCTQQESRLQRDKPKIQTKLDIMEDDVFKSLSMMEIMEKFQTQEQNQGFTKFLQERKFKRKFVEYLIEHVENQSALLSQKTIEARQQKQLNLVLSNEDETAALMAKMYATSAH